MKKKLGQNDALALKKKHTMPRKAGPPVGVRIAAENYRTGKLVVERTATVLASRCTYCRQGYVLPANCKMT